MSSDPPTGLGDIYGMYNPGTEISNIETNKLGSYLPLHTQYACRYWVDHLEQLEIFQQEEAGLCDDGQVHEFLQKHLLHWLEALGIMGNIFNGATMVRT